MHCKFGQTGNVNVLIANHGTVSPAREHLQEARAISAIHKATHPAKYARCLFKLSEAQRQDSRRQGEAEQQLREAEDLYYQITGKPGVTSVQEADFDALIHISQR